MTPTIKGDGWAVVPMLDTTLYTLQIGGRHSQPLTAAELDDLARQWVAYRRRTTCLHERGQRQIDGTERCDECGEVRG